MRDYQVWRVDWTKEQASNLRNLIVTDGSGHKLYHASLHVVQLYKIMVDCQILLGV